MRKYDVFDGHLSKTFMELNTLPDVESPSLGVCGDIPTLGQHWYDRSAVESSHPEGFGDRYDAVQENLGITDEFRITDIRAKFFLANAQCAGRFSSRLGRLSRNRRRRWCGFYPL